MLFLTFTATTGAVFAGGVGAFERTGTTDFGALAGTDFVACFVAGVALETGFCTLGETLGGTLLAGLTPGLGATFTGFAAALGFGLADGLGAGFAVAFVFCRTGAFACALLEGFATVAFFGAGFAAFGADLVALLLDVPEAFFTGFFTGRCLFVP